MVDGSHDPSGFPHPEESGLPISEQGSNGKPVKASRRWARWTLYGLGGFFVVVALLIGFTALRLSISPLSISSFVDDIEEMAAQNLPAGQTLLLDDVQISFAENGGLALRLSQVELRQGDNLLLSAPRIDLEVRFLALFADRLRPSMIYVPGMTVRAQRERSGRFLIAGQDPGAVGEVMGPPTRSQAVFYDRDEPEFVSLIYSMRRAIQPLADKDLDKRPPRILIKNTDVTFQDDISRHERIFKRVAFSYDPVGENDNLWRIDFAVDGHHGRIGFAMAEYPLSKEERGVEGRSVEFRFADVSMADFLPAVANNENAFQFSSPFYGAARMDFDLKGVLVDMKLALDVGSGRMDFGPKDTALLDEASFRFDWQPDIRALKLERAAVYFGETGGEFRGLAVWPEKREGDVRVAIEGLNIKLAARDNDNPAKLLRQMILQARVGRDTGIATIDHFAMVADEGSLQGSGSTAFVDGELTAGMTFVVSAMPYDLLTHMWPVPVANGARKWVIDHVEGGRTTGGNIDVAITQSMFKRDEKGLLRLPDDAVQVKFGVENLHIKGFGDLPPAEDIGGRGLVTGRTFIANITGGRFITKKGRSFAISSGKFEIPDHSEKPATGILALDGSGSAKAFGEIVDSEPLHVLRSEQQTPEGVKGKAHVRVQISFPFVKPLKKEDVNYSARIELVDFSSDHTIRGREISDADLVIDTDGSRVDIEGTGKIDSLSTKIDLTTSTDHSVSPSSKFELVMSDDDRRRMGLDIGKWLHGPIRVKVAQNGKNEDVTHFSVDLTKSVITLDEIGWSKKINVRGQATFDLTQVGSVYKVKNIKVQGDGFLAQGSAEVDAKNGLKSLKISNLRLSRGDRLWLNVVQNKKNFYSVRLTGDVLDLRGRLMSNPTGQGTADDKGSKDSYSLSASIKKVIGLSGHVINDLVANVQVVNGKEKSVRVRGLLDGRSNLEVNTKNGKVPTLHLSSDDAGALFRFAGVIDRVLSGRLALSIALRDGWDHISGSLFLKDFNLGGQMQKQKSKTSSTEQINSSFSKLTLNYEGKKGVYTVTSGVVKGPVLGATVSGTIDMRSKELALSGTYIPAYGVNNIFSRLPIIGRALGNRKNEGLLGITYKIKGNMANPQVIINPASLLAPGALRKIFEFH